MVAMFGKELLLPSMVLIGSARNYNQDLILVYPPQKKCCEYADEVIVLTEQRSAGLV